jgi:hypothetical protein
LSNHTLAQREARDFGPTASIQPEISLPGI